MIWVLYVCIQANAFAQYQQFVQWQKMQQQPAAETNNVISPASNMQPPQDYVSTAAPVYQYHQQPNQYNNTGPGGDNQYNCTVPSNPIIEIPSQAPAIVSVNHNPHMCLHTLLNIFNVVCMLYGCGAIIVSIFWRLADFHDFDGNGDDLWVCNKWLTIVY